LFAAIAMATLQNGVFTLFPLALAVFVSMRTWTLRIGLALLLPVLAAALAFTVYPVLPSIDATGVHLGGALSHNVFFSDFTFGGFAVVSQWFLGHDPIFAVLTVLGFAAAIVWLGRHGRTLFRGERRHVAIALAYVVPYALLLLVSQDVYERFLLPLLPWFAIVAARPWRIFVDGVNVTGVTIAGRAVLALVLAAPLVVLGRFAWVSLQPDTFTQAADWISNDKTARAAAWSRHRRCRCPSSSRRNPWSARAATPASCRGCGSRGNSRTRRRRAASSTTSCPRRSPTSAATSPRSTPGSRNAGRSSSCSRARRRCACSLR
jgi:hypothetical protein